MLQNVRLTKVNCQNQCNTRILQEKKRERRDEFKFEVKITKNIQ